LIDSTLSFESISLPNTNGWDNGWRIVNIGNISISKKTELKIVADVGGFNLKNIIFEDLDISSIPMKLNLKCYPNPSNALITIAWESDFALLTYINIYTLSGINLFNESILSLKVKNSIDWAPRTNNGRTLPSGVYLIKIETANSNSVKKITYLK